MEVVCELCKLTEVMHQKSDHKFVEILNNIRIGKAIDVDLLAKCKTNIDKVKADTTLLYAKKMLGLCRRQI